MTREEYDQNCIRLRKAFVVPDPPPWAISTWKERVGHVVFYMIMWGVVFPAMLFGAVWVLGTMAEGIVDYNMQHDRCLKQAINGYEIRRCR